MSRIDIQTVDSAAAEVAPRLAAAQRASGFVPNLLGVLANAPTAIEAYQTVSAINARSGLTAAEREVVQISAAVSNGCGFCTAGHTKLARHVVKMDPLDLDALRAGTALPSPRLNALATFTREVIAERGNVSDAQLQGFLDSGYTHATVLEVVLGVSLATLCNYANNLARTPINPELQPFALH
ncbi:MAG: carboxymuconolactone decarboxylase family protein [Rhodanobacter sp.]